MEKSLYELRVDPEFAKLIPPLQDTELSLLTDSILANGCEMPLVVWNGTLVDGHNRYRICHENGVPFAIEEKEFDSRETAELWLIKNQLGRRNLTDYQKCELVLPMEELLKAAAEKRMLLGKRQLSDPLPNLAGGQGYTRNVMAAMAGVSHGSLDKAKRIMATADEETKDQLRRGELSIHRAYSALTQVKPQTEEDAREGGDTPQSVPTGKPEYGSLLKKPVFDHYEPPAYMEPIPFEPVVPTEQSETSVENEEESSEQEQEEQPVLRENHAAERIREIGQAFLDGLDEALKGLGGEGVDQILGIVEDVGEKAVQTVKKHFVEH